MASLNIVLVQPEIPQNTGNIVRTCSATGARLHIIEPMGFKVDDKKLKRAGLDYWWSVDITYYPSLDDFFLKNKGDYYFFTTKAAKKYTDIAYKNNCFLFFGKETAGLPEELLVKHPENSVRIPMVADCRSLNLSNSVALGVYEVLRQWGFPNLVEKGSLHRLSW